MLPIERAGAVQPRERSLTSSLATVASCFLQFAYLLWVSLDLVLNYIAFS
jgi:hypothetical protein